MNYDWIVTVVIFLILGLAIWAKVSQQTVIELLRDIRDFMADTKENLSERGETIKVYN